MGGASTKQRCTGTISPEENDTGLPIEIWKRIFYELPDLRSFISLRVTCKTIYSVIPYNVFNKAASIKNELDRAIWSHEVSLSVFYARYALFLREKLNRNPLHYEHQQELKYLQDFILV